MPTWGERPLPAQNRRGMPARLDTGGLAHTAIILGQLCGSVVSAEPGLPFPARACRLRLI